jgi:hypothetical protein
VEERLDPIDMLRRERRVGGSEMRNGSHEDTRRERWIEVAEFLAREADLTVRFHGEAVPGHGGCAIEELEVGHDR